MKRFSERTVFKNQNGKVVRIEDKLYGGWEYAIFGKEGNHVKTLSHRDPILSLSFCEMINTFIH